jgi:hypothetical protein
MILYKSPADSQAVRLLGTQLFPGHKNYLLSAYEQACSKPYSFIVIDLRQEIPENLRVRDDIRVKKDGIVYLPAPR